MLKSLYLYTRYFFLTAVSARVIYLGRELYRYYLSGNRYCRKMPPEPRQRKLAKARAVNWLLQAQQSMSDDGFGSYHMINNWSASYPETTGYILPTLLQYAEANNDKNINKIVTDAADWLISIQRPSGGWQGGRVNEDKAEVVFNTAQIIRGLLAVFKLTQNEKYVDSAVRAGDWLCEIQDESGTWTKHALMGRARVYDSYVDYPLLMLHKQTAVEKYRKHAIKNLDWIVDQRQHENAWFEDCDNTVKHNDRPILHTIAYTIDGLLDCGVYLDERKYIDAARKAADVLRDKFEQDGYLHGRYNSQWEGSEHMILTGCAQMSIIWLKIAHYAGNKYYAETAMKMNTLLIFLQNRKLRKESANTAGALSGSYPFWGKYEPFAFPNWGTKYFADAIMLEEEYYK
ncbi:MAG: prenyltransferase/squalene oxidase repeat-containing protein [Bacteroidota bacterium]